MTVPELRTERLLLREWCDDDIEPFAALNADPAVMEHFPTALTHDDTVAMVGRIREQWRAEPLGLWAVEVPGVAPFIGFIGLSRPTFAAHFTPCVEVGWRLAASAWGHGYAPEGARAVLHYGFEVLGLEEIVSFTTAANMKSRRVMEKIGMTRDPADDFDHPGTPGWEGQRHVLYRVRGLRP